MNALHVERAKLIPFRDKDERVHNLMDTPKIADLRNIYEPDVMREHGFDYVGVGR